MGWHETSSQTLNPHIHKADFNAEQYIRLLNERRPEALVLFAHYCVLLSYCDYSWHFCGVGKRLIAAIWRSLSVEMRPWISWPVAVTGAIVDDDYGVSAWVEEQE